MDKQLYQKKYLKYKIKYLKLMNPNVQIPRNILNIYYGGNSEIEELQKLFKNTITKETYKIYLDSLRIEKKDTYKLDFRNYFGSNQINLNSYEETISNFFIPNFNKIHNIIETYKAQVISNKWIKCKDKCTKKDKECIRECYTTLNNILKQEINKAFYILRTLKKSIITIVPEFDYNNCITINSNIDFNKSWEDVSKSCNLKLGNTHDQNCKLIFGFGPSASGKTKCAEKMIDLFKKNDTTFPTTFITIDGGICRESSILYNFIILCLRYYNIYGIENLDINDPIKELSMPRLFPKVKHIIRDFLSNSDKSYSLYIPETLSKPKFDPKKYIEISKDKEWIGLLIWQHKGTTTDSKCPYTYESLKCEGCVRSGKSRERYEGKIYKDTNWEKSMDNGLTQIKIAPGGGYSIHNSGRTGGDLMIIDWTTQSKEIKTALKNILNLKKFDNLPDNVMFIEKYKLNLLEKKWYDNSSIIIDVQTYATQNKIKWINNKCSSGKEKLLTSFRNRHYNNKYKYKCREDNKDYLRPYMFNIKSTYKYDFYSEVSSDTEA